MIRYTTSRMLPRALAVGLPSLLLIAPACTASGTSGESGTAKSSPAESAASTRERQCTQIAKQASGTAALAVGVLAAGLADDAKSATAALSEAKPELGAAARKMRDDCMGWSDETVKCLTSPFYAASHGDECERSVAAALGEPLPPDDVGAGPKPAWTHTYPASPTYLHARPDGLVVARLPPYGGDDEKDASWHGTLVAIRDGATVWTAKGKHDEHVVPFGDVYLAVARADRRLHAYAADTGNARWSYAPTAKGIPDFDPEWDSPPRVALVAIDGDHVVVGDDHARFVRLAKDGAKPEPFGALTDETLDSDARLLFGAGGVRWLWEGYDLRAFDQDWNTIASLRCRDSFSDVVIHDGVAHLLMDDEVIAIDPARCGDKQVAPSAYPHPGDLTFEGSDECPDCVRPPPGCVTWRHHVRDVSPEPLTATGGGLIVVNDSTQTHALGSGGVAWSAATAAGGRAALGASLFVVSPGGEDADPAKLWALDPGTGTHRWASPLPAGAEGFMYSTDKVHVVAAGDWVAAGYDRTIAAFRVAAAP